jgi:hypothetical protein
MTGPPFIGADGNAGPVLLSARLRLISVPRALDFQFGNADRYANIRETAMDRKASTFGWILMALIFGMGTFADSLALSAPCPKPCCCPPMSRHPAKPQNGCCDNAPANTTPTEKSCCRIESRGPHADTMITPSFAGHAGGYGSRSLPTAVVAFHFTPSMPQYISLSEHGPPHPSIPIYLQISALRC